MNETAAVPEAVTSIGDVETVVDSDFHLTERQEDFLPYIQDPFDKVISNERGEDAGYISSFYPSAGLFNSGVVSGKVQMGTARSQEDILQAMDELGVDQPVVTPTQNLYLAGVHHDELAAALANAYNNWVLDKIFDAEKGIYGPALVAPQKPEKAAEEIDDRKDEDEIVGIFVPSGGTHPPLGNERYHPIYEACEAAGLPVIFHNASGTQMLNFPLQYHGTNRYMSNHAPTHAMTHMVHLTDIITRGVPVKFSDLEFVFQEAGLGWIPYMMRRLDNEYSEKREDAPMLEQMPSDYIRDQFYFTSQPVEGAKEPEYITNIVKLLGVDNLLFSSDYPHLDFDHPGELLQSLRNSFTSDEIENVYGRTALEVYDF